MVQNYSIIYLVYCSRKSIDGETFKFIQNSDDLSLYDYLFFEPDKNICLFRGFRLSNASFTENDLISTDLNGFCDNVRDANSYAENKDVESCFNVLRFTNQTNPGEILYFMDDYPSLQQIDCT